MKKIKKMLIFVMVLSISIWISKSISVSANSSDSFNIYELKEDTVLVGTLNKNGSAKRISEVLGNNILFEYQPFDSVSSKDNDEKEVAKLYYYKNNVFHNDTLSTYSTDENEIKKEIDEFYNERMQYIKEEKNTILTETPDNSLFSVVTNGTKRVIAKPYGYMDHHYVVKKYRANNVSSLYIVETESDFVPGVVPYRNNDTSYDKDMRNYSGYIHLVANQAKEELDQSSIRYGGVPHIKDAWPLNSPGMITITSSFTMGLSLGYSFKNGFSLDNISAENQYNVGANIGYGYSKQYTIQEPRLSTQHDSNNYNKYQWSYQYEDSKNGDTTFHLSTRYMFEMNNSGHSLIGEGQFGLEYRFRLQVKKIGLFGKVQKPCDGFLYVNWW